MNPSNLNGGMVDVVSGLVGQLAHRYLNVDPTTGRIIGSIAGNLIFNLGHFLFLLHLACIILNK